MIARIAYYDNRSLFFALAACPSIRSPAEIVLQHPCLQDEHLSRRLRQELFERGFFQPAQTHAVLAAFSMYNYG